MENKLTEGEILSRIAAGPIGQQMLEEIRVDREQERARLAAEIDAIRTKHLQALPALRGALEARQAELKANQEAVKVSAQAVAAARVALTSASFAQDREVGTRQGRLFALAPACVGELKAWAQAEAAAIRRDFHLPHAGGMVGQYSTPSEIQASRAADARVQQMLAAKDTAFALIAEIPALCEQWLAAGLRDDALELECVAKQAEVLACEEQFRIALAADVTANG
jgi:hypothetical protein